MQHINWL